MAARVSAGSLRPIRATCAPAAASASAMARPRPVLAPVTAAMRPDRSKRLIMSAQHVHGNPGDVLVFLVLAAHGPDEAVVRRAAAGVDAPGWRDDGLLVGHEDVPGLVRLAHDVHHARIG